MSKPIREYPKDEFGFYLIPASVWREFPRDYKGKYSTPGTPIGERHMMGMDERGITTLFPVRIQSGK